MSDAEVTSIVRAILRNGNSAIIRTDKNGNFVVSEVKKKVTVKN